MQARQAAAPLCLVLLGLAGCATQGPAAQGSRNPMYSTDLTGKAANCTAAAVALQPGKETAASLSTGGGGWCGIPVTQDGRSLDAALLTQPPRNGAVYVHTVGDDTRVDYTPRAAAGADSFALRFIPGDATMTVTVAATGAQPAKGVAK